MCFHFVRAVRVLRLELDEVVESLFCFLNLVSKSLLAPIINACYSATEAGDITLYLLQCCSSLFIFEFCAQNNCSLVFVHCFTSLWSLALDFSFKSKDFNVSRINILADLPYKSKHFFADSVSFFVVSASFFAIFRVRLHALSVNEFLSPPL